MMTLCSLRRRVEGQAFHSLKRAHYMFMAELNYSQLHDSRLAESKLTIEHTLRCEQQASNRDSRLALAGRLMAVALRTVRSKTAGLAF
jgi:hypothetical protein